MMEQKKQRRHPNFFDIIFVVVILAVAVAAYLISHDSGTRGQATVSRSYILELTQLQEGMESCVAVGDTVTDNIKNYEIGTVTDIQVVPYTSAATDEEAGVVKQAAMQGYISLQLTIEADTVETESEISTVSGYTLRVGASVSCTVGSLKGSGYILQLDR